MELFEVMPLAAWEELVESFAAEVSMTACLADRAGNPLFCKRDRFALCAAVRANPEAARYICSQTNASMLAVVNKTLRPEVDLCEAGLLRAVIPVVRDGAPVGHIMTCGLAVPDEEPSLMLLARQLGVGGERVRELLQQTPLGDEDQLSARAAALHARLNPAGA